jgi:hypothetical protein
VNPITCHHPHEHQVISVSRELREIEHECALCGHVEVQTLGVVDRKLSTIEEPLYVD